MIHLFANGTLRLPFGALLGAAASVIAAAALAAMNHQQNDVKGRGIQEKEQGKRDEARRTHRWSQWEGRSFSPAPAAVADAPGPVKDLGEPADADAGALRGQLHGLFDGGAGEGRQTRGAQPARSMRAQARSCEEEHVSTKRYQSS